MKRELGDKEGIATSFSGLGVLAYYQGDYAQARALHEESLAIRRELGDRRGIAECLEGLAKVACTQGRSGQAALLFGAAEALRQAIQAPLPPNERADYERHVAATRSGLSEAAFAAAWAHGQAMTLEQAIAYALEKME